MPSPSDYMRAKITVPAAGMSSADWDGVDPDIRERSYWTAREGCYARVQGFRDRCQGIVDGNLSEADALREVRAMLRATGYQPEPGTEGTIQDLNSDARQRLILDTNVAMVRERAYRDSMLGSLAYPAQRLVRIRYSRQPRDWDARWREAAAAVNYEGVATDGSHIALLTSPIWRKLSRSHNHDHLSYPFICSNVATNMEDALSQNFKLMTHPRQQSKYAPLRLFQAFDSAARQYHPIKDDTIAVITPYGRGEECREKLWNMNPHTDEEWEQWNEWLQKARAYSVAISSQLLEKYLNSGDIMRIQEGVDIYTTIPNKYDPFLGFLTDPGETSGALTVSRI